MFFLLGDSPAFGFYMLTFRDTLFHLNRSCEQDHYHPMAPLPRYLSYLSNYRSPLGVIAPPQPVPLPGPHPPSYDPFSFRLACINTLAISSLLYCLLTRPMKMEEGSETSTPKIQKPGNHPKERIQHSEHGEILKSRIDLGYLYRI